MGIGARKDYGGDLEPGLLIEAVANGDEEVLEHAFRMRWPMCPSAMTAACLGRHFALMTRMREVWNAAVGIRCTEDVLDNGDGDMIKFLIKHDMLCETSIDMIGDHVSAMAKEKKRPSRRDRR